MVTTLVIVVIVVEEMEAAGKVSSMKILPMARTRRTKATVSATVSIPKHQ
jgi:hypothetical protein